MPPGGTSSLHLLSSGLMPLLRKRSVPSRRESLHLGPRYLAIVLSTSDAPLLGRATTVMRDRRHVFDARDLQSAAIQRADRGFASRPRAAHADFDGAQAVFLGRYARLLRRHLRGERRALARAAKTGAARRRPGERVALPVGDRDDRVVERRVDMRHAVGNLALRLLARLRGRRRRALGIGLGVALLLGLRVGCGFGLLFAHQTLPACTLVLIAARRGPLRVRALVRVRCPRAGSPLRWRMPR